MKSGIQIISSVRTALYCSQRHLRLLNDAKKLYKLGLIKKLQGRDSFGIDLLLTRSLVDRVVNEPAR
jgi:hypothetical protein